MEQITLVDGFDDRCDLLLATDRQRPTSGERSQRRIVCRRLDLVGRQQRVGEQPSVSI